MENMQFLANHLVYILGEIERNSLSKNLVINIEKIGGNYPCTL